MSLQPFEDHDVAECALRIVRAGDGLSESLAAAPVELDLGTTVFVLLRGTVARVTYEAVKDSEELRRVHTVRTTFGTILDPTKARPLLEAGLRVIEDANGVAHLPGTG